MKIRTRGAMKYLLEKARLEAENECGCKFTEDFVEIVLMYSKKKLKAIGKPEGYLPLLFRSELTQHNQMQIINQRNRLFMKGKA